jgi:hypothetical protein
MVFTFILLFIYQLYMEVRYRSLLRNVAADIVSTVVFLLSYVLHIYKGCLTPLFSAQAKLHHLISKLVAT